jgi:hypothetical protein
MVPECKKKEPNVFFRAVSIGVFLMVLGYSIIYLVPNLYVIFVCVAIGGFGIGLCV